LDHFLGFHLGDSFLLAVVDLLSKQLGFRKQSRDQEKENDKVQEKTIRFATHRSIPWCEGFWLRNHSLIMSCFLGSVAIEDMNLGQDAWGCGKWSL
jgi:hypothetical protein